MNMQNLSLVKGKEKNVLEIQTFAYASYQTKPAALPQ
jgi:hypothetical protein